MLLVNVSVVTFGLVIGSFLNVCIHRMPRGQSIVSPGSNCPHCHHSIRAWENIPVFSYLFLLGRCRSCGGKIFWVYPLVETTSAVSFYFLFLKFGISLPFLINVVFFAILIILVFVDLFERILPNVLTLGGSVLGLLVSPLQSSDFFQNPGLRPEQIAVWTHYIDSGLGVLMGGGLLWVVAALYLKLRKIEGMGFGDIKMVAMVGAFLGWRHAWLTILLGSLLGALIGSAFIFLYRKGARYELPFGSFLGLAAMVTTLWGREMFGWYSSFL